MTESELSWLSTEDGAQYLETAQAMPADRLQRLDRLRRQLSAEKAAAVVEQLELRLRAREKFSNASQMLFTREGLEQATSERIAGYRASRFPSGSAILDGCCGIGGDAIALQARGPVLATDLSPAVITCASHNLQLSSESSAGQAHCLCADVTRLDYARLSRQDVAGAFLDPSRRGDGRDAARCRVKASEDYSPPLSFAASLGQFFPYLAIKVSPAIDDEALATTGLVTEFLSYRGECREAILWKQPGTNSDLFPTATVLYEKTAYTLHRTTLETQLAQDPSGWLIEPDPAVIRADLIPTLAKQVNAAPIDPYIAYLTSDEYIPSPFADHYRILEWLPYHEKRVQARLKSLGRRTIAIKKRGVPYLPEELRKTLRGTGKPGDPPAVVTLGRRGEQIIAILSEPRSPAFQETA